MPNLSTAIKLIRVHDPEKELIKVVDGEWICVEHIKNNKQLNIMNNQNTICPILYLKENYPGLDDFDYEVAAEIGNKNYFLNMNRQILNVNYPPYISRIGETYHNLFIERSVEHLKRSFRRRMYATVLLIT
jgi:hypothetical protein